MTPEGSPRRTDPARRRGAAASRADAPAPTVREISLRGMRFHTLVGILEHERTTPQPLEVDLTVHASANGGILDYRRLYELVAQHVGAGPTDYLETLADRIAEGPIPLDESLTIARQIADALEAAHEKNIVHRDLKPGNIKLQPNGALH